MGTRVLEYDRGPVRQDTFYWCGPAATQTVLNSKGIFVPESVLAKELGTTQNGTNSADLIIPSLNSRLGSDYRVVNLYNWPPTQEQSDKLWWNVINSIETGCGVIANIQVPPNNYPRGVNGSVSPAYSGGTVYHYIDIMGYTDEAPDVGRAYWVADSGFSPYGYWCSHDQMMTMIPPKAYAYNAQAPVKPPAVADEDPLWKTILTEFVGPAKDS